MVTERTEQLILRPSTTRLYYVLQRGVDWMGGVDSWTMQVAPTREIAILRASRAQVMPPHARPPHGPRHGARFLSGRTRTARHSVDIVVPASPAPVHLPASPRPQRTRNETEKPPPRCPLTGLPPPLARSQPTTAARGMTTPSPRRGSHSTRRRGHPVACSRINHVGV